jgi:hypothetical protein
MQDKELKILKYLALGAVGIYLLRSFQKTGALGADVPGGGRLSINPDRLVDTAMPWINLPEPHRTMLRHGAKEFLKGLKKS